MENISAEIWAIGAAAFAVMFCLFVIWEQRYHDEIRQKQRDEWEERDRRERERD